MPATGKIRGYVRSLSCRKSTTVFPTVLQAILQILENAAGNHSANMGDSIADANKKENICAIPSGEQYECVKDNILSLIKKMDALTYESIL